MQSLRFSKLVLAALFALGLAYHLFFLRTFSHWWFEDDPSLFAMVKATPNPLAFFLDRTVMLEFSRALVPMQGLSMWLDSALAYRNIRIAQIHHLLVLQITVVLLFAVLRNFGLGTALSLAFTIAWLLLPAVIVTNEFLSARHYLEGFAWTLAALLLAQRIKASNLGSAWQILFLFAFLIAAALSKEVFAITVPLAVCFLLYDEKRRSLALTTLTIATLHVFYRWWAFGTDPFYSKPYLGPADYLLFLGRLPYILLGNWGGYLLVATAGVLLIYLHRHGRVSPRALWGLGLSLGSALLVIYPVSYALFRDWLEHGTWYRTAFALASGLLLTLAFLTSKIDQRLVRNSVVGALLVFACWGGLSTQGKWHQAMQRYKYEGRYYLAHPQRLLYSELPAFWYLPGLDQLYAVPESHHIAAARSDARAVALEKYETIWRYNGREFVKDPKLFAELVAGKGSAR